MRVIAVMLLIVSVSMLFITSANASGNPYVKVDSWTLGGFAGVRQTSGPVAIVPINIPGFGTEAACLEAITDIQNRTYPGTSGSSSTIIGTLYASFSGTCHNVKAVVPIDPVAP